MPVFALGRMQEVFAILHDARKFGRLVDCPIFTGGLGVDLADYFRKRGGELDVVGFSLVQVQGQFRTTEELALKESNHVYSLDRALFHFGTPASLAATTRPGFNRG